MMSANITAASTLKRRTGCNVTSAHNSAFATMSTSLYFSRNLRYSGNERPAWRIIQIGVTSTGSRLQAARKRGSGIAGRLDDEVDIRVVVRGRQEPRLECEGGSSTPAARIA